MPSPRDTLVEETFSLAAELPRGERDPWLAEQVTKGVIDAAVADLVRFLLHADESREDDLKKPFFRPVSGGAEASGEAEQRPQRVAGYTVGVRLGSGGMGNVYAATHDATGRAVALKLLRPGLATRRYLDRFRLEAESLARLSEPRIAQLYDSGVATVEFSDGLRAERPFIVMELIAGMPIVAAARARGLTVSERIRLVEAVARAVQHAHQRGVIHRDLKPGNILLTDDGMPKIVDFGIARLIDSEHEGITVTGQVLGTARYMSPEQASGQADLVDTRSDVFSIGAVLYELLAGRPMIEADNGSTLRPLGGAGVRPPRLASIVPELRGDIDAVVHKAIELDPRDRYQSAGDLADDLVHLLNAEPVTARVAGTLELMIRSARRNKPLTAAVVVAALAMIAGTAASLWQADIAREQAALAREESERAGEHARHAEQASTDARRQLAEAIRQRDLLRGTREAAHVLAGRIQEVLTRTASKGPAHRAALLESMRESLDIAAANNEPQSVVGRTASYDGISQFYEALDELPLALEWREKSLRVLEEADHPEDVLHLTERALVADLRMQVDPQADAAECERVLRDSREKLAKEMLETEQIMVRLAQCHAGVLEKLGRFDESRQLYERLLVILDADERRSYVATHVRGMLGVLNRKMGRYREALPLIEAVIADRKARQAPEIDLCPWYDNLGFVCEGLGLYDKAIDAYTQKSEAEGASLGADDPRTAFTLGKLGRVLTAQRRDAEALPILERCVPVLRRQPQYTNSLAGGLVCMAQLHIRRGALDEAAAPLDECVAIYDSTASILDNRYLLSASLVRADLLLAKGETASAETLLLGMHETLRAAGATNRDVTERLVNIYTRLGRTEDARRWQTPSN